MAAEHDLKHGHAHKASPSIGGSWGKKWIVLTADSLKYFSGQHSDSPKGVCPIECETVAARVRSGQDRRASNSTNYLEKRNGVVYHKLIKKPHVFSLETIEKADGVMLRTWYFQVDSDEEREAWIKAINEAANAVAKSEAGVARFLARHTASKNQMLSMASNEQDATMWIKVKMNERHTAMQPEEAAITSPGVSAATILGKLEADEVSSPTASISSASVTEMERAGQLIQQMAQNTANGIVDFAVQREYMQTMSKIPQMRAMITAPGWVAQLMLPGRGGLWIDNVTPISPASFCKDVETQHQVIVGVSGQQLPNEPGTALEMLGSTRWALAEQNQSCTFTVYNLKSRLFSTITIDPNPANLPKPPMAGGLMMKWVEGADGTGITANNAEPLGAAAGH